MKFTLKSKAEFPTKLSMNSPQPEPHILSFISIFCPAIEDKMHKKHYHVPVVTYAFQGCGLLCP